MIAYTEKLGFDVLTAPIAEVDRRTLSQAWFSALHVAGAPDSQAPSCPSRVVPPERSQFVEPEPIPRSRSGRSSAVRSPHRRPVSTLGADEETSIERRAPRSVLARRIERTLLHLPMRRAAFTLDIGKGRVHLSVRSDGSRVHLIAVCAPQAREDVARALQQVRFSFTRKGRVFESSLRENAL